MVAAAIAACHLRASSGLYGAEHMLLGLCREQARRGAAPLLAVFARRSEPAPVLLGAAADAGLNVRTVTFDGLLDHRCLRSLRRQLGRARAEGMQVLHCHDYRSVVYGRIAAVGLGLRLVATAHGWLDATPRLRAYRALEQRLLRGFDRVCAVSPAILAELRRAGIAEQRSCHIANGIDLERFHPTPSPRDGPPLQIGCAARLSPEKNLLQLIAAVALARRRGHDLQLTVYGEGPQRAELEAAVAGARLQHRVGFPGARGDLERWYPSLDCFALVSTREGTPLVVLEALACGCPVLASDVGALAAMLAGLPDCRVLPAGDLDALVAALCALQPRVAAAPALRERVQADYSVEAMADAYQDVYRQALAA